MSARSARENGPETPTVRMGVSSGLLLETMGTCALVGRLRCVCAIFACVSCKARSMSRDRSKVAVTRADPVLADEVMVMTPLTWESASSIGLTMPVSTSSGALRAS